MPAASKKPVPPRPAPVSARGAVDLSTYRAAGTGAAAGPPGAAAGRPAGGQLAPGAYAVEVTEANFQAEVLDRSADVPVVLDLWATWCEPCKQLSPILERLADEYTGRFVLATIDVDAEQRIATALQVQSIPTVLAVVAGQLVPLFTGAVPEEQVRAVLEEVLRVAVSQGVTGRAEPRPGADDAAADDGVAEPEPEDQRFLDAADLVDDGDFDGAVAIFRRILATEPDNTEATLALAQTQLLARTDGVDPAAARAHAAADPGDPAAAMLAADLDMLDGLVAEAFARLIEVVRRSSGAERDQARLRLVELFSLVGPEDPRVPAARMALANALF